MPRGGKRGSHKGGRRHFTNPEELEIKRKQEEEERSWREQRGEIPEDDEEDGESEADSSDDDVKRKGVEGLIDVHNPNRVGGRQHRKASELNEVDTKTQLSRREREELEKQQARARYEKLHAEGKTDEARADLARLALIRKQREEAAKRRDEEKKAKEAAAKAALQEERARRAKKN